MRFTGRKLSDRDAVEIGVAMRRLVAERRGRDTVLYILASTLHEGCRARLSTCKCFTLCTVYACLGVLWTAQARMRIMLCSLEWTATVRTNYSTVGTNIWREETTRRKEDTLSPWAVHVY